MDEKMESPADASAMGVNDVKKDDEPINVGEVLDKANQTSSDSSSMELDTKTSDQVINEANIDNAETNKDVSDPVDQVPVVSLLDDSFQTNKDVSDPVDPVPVVSLLDDSFHIVSEVHVQSDENPDSMANQLKTINLRMDEYEKQIKEQNHEIAHLKEQIKDKDKEIEKYQTRNQDTSFVKNRLKEKDKEFQNMKQEFNRNRSLVGDLQMSVKQVHNQLKAMANNALEFEDRLSDLEKLSPKLGVFEWRLDNYIYHSQNAEYLTSPEFYTHLNGYCCYLSVQWFGNKCGRLGIYLHLDKKKNMHLVETCKINMLIQCVGSFGLTKDHVINYDVDDASSDSSMFDLDETIISGDHYFLLKPYLDKYLIDDCLYFYVNLLSDPCLEA